jgi:hypothetical protein
MQFETPEMKDSGFVCWSLYHQVHIFCMSSVIFYEFEFEFWCLTILLMQSYLVSRWPCQQLSEKHLKILQLLLMLL